ncbi:MAG: alpha/beta fold hydrolase [Polyangiaceae bacterium]
MKLSLVAMARLGLLASTFSLVACSGAIDPEGPAPTPSPSTTTEPTPAPPTPGPGPESIAWATCEVPGMRGDIEADCATVDMPAQRGKADSGTVPVAVYRLKAAKQPAKAQMWMLNGGPGGAGFGLGPYGELVAQTFTQSIDVYLIDHRGTGESDFLDCPKAYRTSQTTGDFMKKCSQEIRDSRGAKLDGYSTTESAHDVRELIDRTAGKDQKVYVYGGSYGSYWAHRLLQIPNVRVDAVITDGNCISSTCTFDTPQVFGVDETMGYVFDVCKGTPACAEKVGADPKAFVTQLVQKLKAGHCSTARLSTAPLAEVVHTIGAMWASGVMPTLYRLDRCNEGDVRVLNTLEQKLQEVSQRGPVKVPVLGPTPRPSKATDSSTALQLHVIASEMISRPAPSPASLEAKARGLLFSPGADSYDITYFDTWQTYPRDGFMDGWMSRDVPWLMMQGTFDFQTVVSLSKTALPKIADPSLQYVTVDGGGHGVVFDSECSIAITEAFLANPKAKVDTSCLGEVRKKSLDIDARYTQYFMGVQNAWE